MTLLAWHWRISAHLVRLLYLEDNNSAQYIYVSSMYLRQAQSALDIYKLYLLDVIY